jgi:hypothetical protein
MAAPRLFTRLRTAAEAKYVAAAAAGAGKPSIVIDLDETILYR